MARTAGLRVSDRGCRLAGVGLEAVSWKVGRLQQGVDPPEVCLGRHRRGGRCCWPACPGTGPSRERLPWVGWRRSSAKQLESEVNRRATCGARARKSMDLSSQSIFDLDQLTGFVIENWKRSAPRRTLRARVRVLKVVQSPDIRNDSRYVAPGRSVSV